MINLKKSQVPNEYAFVQSLDAHKLRLKEWQDHMRRVDSDALNAKVKPIDKHAPYPRPLAHSLIDQVMQNGGAYQLVDDEEPIVSLDDQKKRLDSRLIDAYLLAKSKIITQAKHDLQAQRAQDIFQSEANKSFALLKGFIGKVLPIFDLEKNRSPEDQKFLQEFNDNKKQLRAIDIKMMQARSDIEDLTETTIKSWKNPEF